MKSNELIYMLANIHYTKKYTTVRQSVSRMHLIIAHFWKESFLEKKEYCDLRSQDISDRLTFFEFNEFDGQDLF